MSSRDAILERIRGALRRNSLPTDATPGIDSHEREHPRGPLPALEADLVARFIARAGALASSVAGPLPESDAPAAVAGYLSAQRLPLCAACWPELAALDWHGAGIEVTARPAQPSDAVGITAAFCAIAETGSLLLLSGRDSEATVSLLPETHVAIVPAGRIVAHLEDGFDLLRRERAGMPRAASFISGPSRTADIEQTVTLGAHGPYRVLIVLTVPSAPQSHARRIP